jgi:UDP-N-acetylmuramoylalanine--D-glutamate ligase
MLGEIQADDVVVLELSSFQLQRTPTVEWSPHVAVITNITPNHLDWHGDFAAYQAAKLNIVRHQNRLHDVVILGPSPEMQELAGELRDARRTVWNYGLEGGVPVAHDGTKQLRWETLHLGVPGRHNRENATAALTVAQALGIAAKDAIAALSTFEALPHRLQRIAERDGVTYYDDSKSTTPEAATTALGAIEAPVLIILGGYDKGSDLRPLATAVARRAKFAACIGTTGRALAKAIAAAGGRVQDCGELAAAVAACRERARVGDVVLLSPGCASWDQFVDYRARGQAFAQLARGDAEVGK